MKKLFFRFVSLGVAACLMFSCAGKKQENVSNEEVEEKTYVETTESEPEPEPEKPKTINGLEPGAEYQAIYKDIDINLTLYSDGSSSSNIGGDCYWYEESIHDQPFIVVLPNADIKYYIDKDQNLHINSASSEGLKLERINYIPDDAKGMVVGHRYTIPRHRWGEDAFITLNEDGTVTSEFHGGTMGLPKWKKVEVDGKEWIIMPFETSREEGAEGGYLISPSLEYYPFIDKDNIQYLGGKLTLGNKWKLNRRGRLQE